MPTYQYECSVCKHELEILQAFKDKKLKKCPQCGKNSLQRLIGTGSGIIFKGSGFYQTDYKNKPSVTETPAKTAAAAPAAKCGQSCACHPG
jgi:putative FmdB family regulatory protein